MVTVPMTKQDREQKPKNLNLTQEKNARRGVPGVLSESGVPVEQSVAFLIRNPKVGCSIPVGIVFRGL